ncbi:MAG: DMT family transporter [Planctomycetota bacterium]
MSSAPPEPRGPSAARGAVASLLSAALFGVSAPLAKRLLPDAGPLSIAGTLYLAGGLGLVALTPLLASLRGRPEAPLDRRDLPTLAGVVLLGGVLAPVLLLVGLARVSGVVGSLLLNLEAPLTVVVAVAAFGEHLGRRGLACLALVLAGAATLTLDPSGGATDPLGVLAVGGACLLWAVDNNLTQRLSGKDPVAITRAKCLVAGATNVALAVGLGHALPGVGAAAAASLVGVLAYGVGLVLATLGMRALGAARHAVLFASAPFVGALAAVPVLGETPRALDVVGMGLMAAGVAVLLRERHDHAHPHEALEHDHLHVHDDHHRHDHAPDDPPGVPHAHRHRHAPIVHAHAHVPDAHHRHDHPA